MVMTGGGLPDFCLLLPWGYSALFSGMCFIEHVQNDIYTDGECTHTYRVRAE